MEAADAFWHLTNFFAPALFLGAFSAAMARAFWRRELDRAGYWRLWGWASGASALASIVGLVVFGRDGRIATYAAMVFACALALWWAGFRASPKPPGARR